MDIEDLCKECLMTNVGAPSSLPKYADKECWALTDLLNDNGELLTITDRDMIRSQNRLRTKLPSDERLQYSGPPVTVTDNCTNRQKRLVLYHKLFRFLYGVGQHGVRVVLPSCCVLRIQNTYKDANNPADIEENFFIADQRAPDITEISDIKVKRKFDEI